MMGGVGWLRGKRLSVGAALASVIALGLTACGADSRDELPSSKPGGVVEPSARATAPPDDVSDAVNHPREDSVYPDAGDPLVDALHYHLDLAWTPDRQRLESVQTLTFRATGDSDTIPLDFTDSLKITELSVDGEETPFEQKPDDLVIDAPISADEEYVVEIGYHGTPEPVDAPTRRGDIDGLGWHVTDQDEVWTMQEPFGAFTWYAVNDQPSDKAFYDFTLRVPEPWTGVANGELTANTDRDGIRTTTWHLAEPAASYLTTVAFADYTVTELESASGVPITLWGLTDDSKSLGETTYAPDAIAWLEKILGPYPFDTAGAVINRGATGMETQTMITLGNNDYATSKAVLVHELAHHWYGNTITPADWSDVWMNEGMAMYLQWVWEAEQSGTRIDEYVSLWTSEDQPNRDTYGPPADFKPDQFGQNNIYVIPALMWHELRQKIGHKSFYAMVRAWPESRENQSVDDTTYLQWVERYTGRELSAFFRAWLYGKRTPPT